MLSRGSHWRRLSLSFPLLLACARTPGRALALSYLYMHLSFLTSWITIDRAIKTSKYGNDINLRNTSTLNNGMLESADPVEDHDTGSLITTFDPTGIYKQQIIFEHTEAQSMQHIYPITHISSL